MVPKIGLAHRAQQAQQLHHVVLRVMLLLRVVSWPQQVGVAGRSPALRCSAVHAVKCCVLRCAIISAANL